MKKSIFTLTIIFFLGCEKINTFENNGSTMSPTFMSGDLLKVEQIKCNNLKRNDIVVFLDPTLETKKRYFVMRVWGLPGELIQILDRSVFINGEKLVTENFINLDGVNEYGNKQKILLGKNMFFVMGDNFKNSWDSRFWGALNCSKLVGKVIEKL
jgi:signal peptidase I